MPSFNSEDVDFDLGNLRMEEDSWARMIRGANNWNFSEAEKNGLPIDGDKLISAKVNNPNITTTLEQFYNKTGGK